jgi:hypothetical protein
MPMEAFVSAPCLKTTQNDDFSCPLITIAFVKRYFPILEKFKSMSNNSIIELVDSGLSEFGCDNLGVFGSLAFEVEATGAMKNHEPQFRKSKTRFCYLKL